MEKEIRNFMKEKKFIIGVPTIVKFKRKDKLDFSKWKATKGTEVMKYTDVLKLLRMIRSESWISKEQALEIIDRELKERIEGKW